MLLFLLGLYNSDGFAAWTTMYTHGTTAPPFGDEILLMRRKQQFVKYFTLEHTNFSCTGKSVQVIPLFKALPRA